jgi:hypothetical protein
VTKVVLGLLLTVGVSQSAAALSGFDVAHVRIGGRSAIIIPLDSSYGQKSGRDQEEILYSLQLCARDAGLAGEVIPVRTDYFGNMRYRSTSGWTGAMRDKSLQWVAENINLSLTCG